MPNDNYLDLDTVVKEWARAEYDAVANRKQKKLRAKERNKRQAYMNLHIDWSDVNIRDRTTQFPLMADNKGNKDAVPDSNANATSAAGAGGGDSVISGLADSAKPSLSLLFKTKFQNKTAEAQEYTMSTKKTTTSTFFTETEHGYSKGIDVSITLKTPCEVLEASAGYHREYSLTNISGQEFSEELEWGVDSVIKVKEGHVAEAELVVYEEKKSGNFEIETDISGRVFVTFTNIKDNNSFVMAVSEDICAVVDDFVRVERRKGRGMDYVKVDKERRVVQVTTKGKCGFQYGVRQEVLVEQKEIES